MTKISLENIPSKEQKLPFAPEFTHWLKTHSKGNVVFFGPYNYPYFGEKYWVVEINNNELGRYNLCLENYSGENIVDNPEFENPTRFFKGINSRNEWLKQPSLEELFLFFDKNSGRSDPYKNIPFP